MAPNLKAEPGCCEEASLLSGNEYIPCNNPALNIVGWKGRSDPPIRMCAACTDHNVRNRGGEVLRPYQANVADNPRAVAGANLPPPDAKSVTDQMAMDYSTLSSTATDLLAGARELPEDIPDEESLGIFSQLIVNMRDTESQAESHRKKEGDAYYRTWQAINGFFNGISERLAKGRGVLQKRVDAYQRAKLERERAERERARLEAIRMEREAREAEEKARREAEELRLAAERARKPEHIETKTEVARDAEADADAARVDRMLAEAATDQARVEAAATPAAMVRTRFEDTGRLVTSKRVPFVEITDASLLDMMKLWPFIKEEEKLRALKAWAKTTSHRTPMEGAVIEIRDVAEIR